MLRKKGNSVVKCNEIMIVDDVIVLDCFLNNVKKDPMLLEN